MSTPIESRPLPAPLAQLAARHPDKVALIGPGRRLTYAEHNARACRLANALRTAGIEAGHHVAVLLHNSVEYLEIAAALTKLGATLVPLNYRLKPPEVDYILRDSDAVALCVGSDLVETVRPLYAELPAPLCARIYVVASLGTEPALIDPEQPLEPLFAAGDEAEPAPTEGAGGTIVYTSGTTGRPKGVYRSAAPRDPTLPLSFFHACRLGPEDRHLVACPLYHAAPALLARTVLSFGGTVVVMPRFDPERFLALVQEHRITSTQVVPTILNRIVNLPESVRARYDVSSLRSLLVAAAPFPFPLKRRVVEYFGNDCLFEWYAATETGLATLLLPEDQLRKPGSCGRALPGVAIRLLDEAGNEVPVGEPGEVYIKSEHILDGYYKNEEATRRATRDGYVSVGDVARVDADGYYYLVDRRIDMVISGGVNIYPAEIEAALIGHPAVEDAAVIGVPDPDWGELPRAYVVLRLDWADQPTETVEAALLEHCGRQLADYKRPRSFRFVRELPYTPSGKLLKRELRTEALRELGYDPATYGLGTTTPI